jgi:GNAT superfamily N-acetyltransferase
MSELATLGLARVSDAREIAEMSRDLIEQGLTWSWTPARVQHFISGPESSVVVARRELQIAAFAIMHFGDEVAHLNLLAVAPEHRRQGLGRQLMSWRASSTSAWASTSWGSCRATTRAAKRHCACRGAWRRTSAESQTR